MSAMDSGAAWQRFRREACQNPLPVSTGLNDIAAYFTALTGVFTVWKLQSKITFLVYGNQTDSNFENVLREQGDLSEETHKSCNYSNYETTPLQVRTHK